MGSRDPRCRTGQEAKCTKSRAQLALANMRRRLLQGGAASGGVLNTGEQQRSFVELAREHSDCESALKGGDLGTGRPGSLEPSVEEVAFSLSVGEVSEPFESPEGVHLLLRTA